MSSVVPKHLRQLPYFAPIPNSGRPDHHAFSVHWLNAASLSRALPKRQPSQQLRPCFQVQAAFHGTKAPGCTGSVVDLPQRQNPWYSESEFQEASHEARRAVASSSNSSGSNIQFCTPASHQSHSLVNSMREGRHFQLSGQLLQGVSCSQLQMYQVSLFHFFALPRVQAH